MERYMAVNITIYREHALDTAFIYLGNGLMLKRTAKEGFALLQKWEKLLGKHATLTFNSYNPSIRDWDIAGWIKEGT